MSWFSELTSKAEAMLVKLDKDAAQALQNPDGLLGGTKILDQTFDRVEDYQDAETVYTTSTAARIGEEERSKLEDEKHMVNKVGFTIPDTLNESTEASLSICQNENMVSNPSLLQPSQLSPESNQVVSSSHQTIGEDTINTTLSDNSDQGSLNNLLNSSAGTDLVNSSKFRIHTGRTSSRLFSTNQSSSKRNKKVKSQYSHHAADSNEYQNGKQEQQQVDSPAADDIRASINQSLKEYTLQSHPPSSVLNKSNTSATHQTSYTSHFDNEPNLTHSTLLESSYSQNDSSIPNRLHSSPSFSIEVPDSKLYERGRSNVNEDIAAMLMKQSAMKKKSTFYLHKVINRLASPNDQANELFGDQMRIKLRRAQLRATSYARRLNYYFRTYPQMKYIVIGYLFLMQLLVIYVLFFYQSSSSSSNDLSSQIKHQQQEMLDSKLKSEIEPVEHRIINNLKESDG